MMASSVSKCLPHSAVFKSSVKPYKAQENDRGMQKSGICISSKPCFARQEGSFWARVIVDAHLADVLIVTSCVFLRQEELPPHPVSFGSVQHQFISFHQMVPVKEIPITPLEQYDWRAQVRKDQWKQPEEVIHYHCSQSIGTTTATPYE